ncbi:MAG: type II toxin-antitoxin system CcdA family antitoxin [Deltaproteobacteria bacterium]|nr:type II toxin-antitoxin system CcdA family antitoxin [Deltaproteobacteria bacterium]
MEAKAKISVTVDRTLLDAAERLGGSMSRSRIFEEALATWVHRKGRAELDRAIEHYYRTRSIAEREEDEGWASLADETVRSRWDD